MTTTIPATAPVAERPPGSPALRAHLAAQDERGLAVLERQADVVRAELARTDTKASLLLALTGGLAAIVATLTQQALPARWPVAVPLGAAALLLAVAVARLLTVVAPVLPATGGVGVVVYARLTPLQLLERLGADGQEREDQLADEITLLSRLAVTKYRVTGQAVRLLRMTLIALVIAASVAAAL